jgi:hypothetical protein
MTIILHLAAAPGSPMDSSNPTGRLRAHGQAHEGEIRFRRRPSAESALAAMLVGNHDPCATSNDPTAQRTPAGRIVLPIPLCRGDRALKRPLTCTTATTRRPAWRPSSGLPAGAAASWSSVATWGPALYGSLISTCRRPSSQSAARSRRSSSARTFPRPRSASRAAGSSRAGRSFGHTRRHPTSFTSSIVGVLSPPPCVLWAVRQTTAVRLRASRPGQVRRVAPAR